MALIQVDFKSISHNLRRQHWQLIPCDYFTATTLFNLAVCLPEDCLDFGCAFEWFDLIKQSITVKQPLKMYSTLLQALFCV